MAFLRGGAIKFSLLALESVLTVNDFASCFGLSSGFVTDKRAA